MGTKREPTAAEALEAWRAAERQSIRATAQREAADVAVEAAALADRAAHATAEASARAVQAANEASRAASATSAAAAMVLKAMQIEGDARRVMEGESLAAEEEARSAHRDAAGRAGRRYGYVTETAEEAAGG